MSVMLQEALERQLQRDSGMPHAYYVVLVALSEDPDARQTRQLREICEASLSGLNEARQIPVP